MTPLRLFWFFFRISATTFGGGIAILGMVRLELAKRDDIGEDEIADLSGLAAAMPGPIAVSSAFLFGRRYGGLPGAIAGVTGAILPPYLIILLLSPLILEYFDNPQVQRFFAGVLAGVGAMIFSMVARDVRRTLTASWWNVVPYLLTIALIGALDVHPLLALAAGLALQFARARFAK